MTRHRFRVGRLIQKGRTKPEDFIPVADDPFAGSVFCGRCPWSITGNTPEKRQAAFEAHVAEEHT